MITCRKSLIMLLCTAAASAAKVHAEESSVVSVRMTKQDVAAATQSQFIKSRDLSNILAEKLTLLATTITERQGGSNRRLVELADSSAQLDHRSYMNHMAVLQYDVDSNNKNADADGIRLHLLGQTKKSTEVKFKEAFPIIETFRKGLNYKFSLSGKGAQSAPSSTPQIRYGLIVQDIQPVDAPAIASLGTSSDMGMEYARPAKVIYTIDRLDEDRSKQPVFTTPVDVEIASSSGPTAQQIFRRPSTDVDLKVEAANSEDSVSDKVGAGALPGAKLTLSQADGLVSTQVITTSRLGKDTLTHQFKLPLYGEANITRKVNESFKPIQTSANNLLVSASAPKLNIHHLDYEDRYKGELLVKRPGFDLGVAVEPRPFWSPGDKLRDTGDKISVTMVNNF